MVEDNNTIVRYPTGQTRYTIPFDYLARPFVVVTLISEANPGNNKVLKVVDDYTFFSATQVDVIAQQDGFDYVQIHRFTSSEPLVDFRDGSVLTAGDLTTAELQAIHISEEGRDQTVELAREYADSAADSASRAKSSEESASASADKAEEIAGKFTDLDGAVESTKESAQKSEESRQASEAAANRAEKARDEAESKADNDFTFPDMAAGIAGTPDGSYFRVPLGVGSDASFRYYRHVGGQAQPVAETIGQAAVAKQLAMMTDDDRTTLLATFSGADMEVGLQFTAGPDGVGIEAENISLTPGTIENKNLSIVEGTNEFPILWTDPDFNIIFAVDSDLNVVNSSVGPTPTTGSNIGELSAYGLGLAAAESQPVALNRATADRKLNIIIGYGQSNSVGADTRYALTTQQEHGNLMLGQSLRGTNYTSGTTDYTYGPVGGENKLYPLVEVVQSTTWGETGMAAMTNVLKGLHNKQLRVQNDTNRLFAVGSAGVSGATIEKLSPAANKSYLRFLDMLKGFKEAADAEGYTVGSCAVVYLGNEADAGKAYDYYYNALVDLKSAMAEDIKSTFGQDVAVHHVHTQYGGQFTADSTHQASARAIIDFCENHADVSFAGCHHQYPGPGAHLATNSYRWQFSNIAKVLHRALNGSKQPTFRMVKAQHSGSTLRVAFKVPVPPITFRTAYNRYVPTDHADRGFTVEDASGKMTGSQLDVKLVAPNVIEIKCSRELQGTVQVSLGDGAHSGIHNIADSDQSESPYTWEFHPDTTQPVEENIAELIGKNYQLYNWCSRYTITSEEA